MATTDYTIATLEQELGFATVSATPPLRAVTLRDFLKMEIPARNYVLDPIVPSQGLVMIYAMHGVGKTYCAIGISVAVASGGTFLKWKAPKPQGVLFIDGEMPASVLQERFARIVETSDCEPQAPLRILTPDMQESGMPDLASTGGQERVNEHITDDIALIIVDNLSSLVRSGKENEAESWHPLQTWALRLRQSGKSVLFVHHAGKSGQQRGTSRRMDVLDTAIVLKRPASYSAEEGAVFEVHLEKARGIYGSAVAPFEAKLTQAQDGKQLWVIRELEGGKFEQIVSMLREGLTQAEIARELNVNKSTVSRHAKKAREQKLL